MVLIIYPLMLCCGHRMEENIYKFCLTRSGTKEGAHSLAFSRA